MPGKVRLFNNTKGNVCGVYIKITGRDLEHLGTLISQGKVSCSCCKKKVGPKKPFFVAQASLYNSHLTVHTICADCCKPIEKAITDAIAREQTQPVPEEAATAVAGGDP